MADTGRTSVRKVGDRRLTLRWYRCQICFALSGELEHDGQDAMRPVHIPDRIAQGVGS
jgi:hypothetical protein